MQLVSNLTVLRRVFLASVFLAARLAGMSRFILVKWVPALGLLAIVLAPFWFRRWLSWRRATAEARCFLSRPGWGLPLVVVMLITWSLGFLARVKVAEHKLGPLIRAAEEFGTKHGRCAMSAAEIGSENLTGWKHVSLGDNGVVVLYDRSLVFGSTIANYVCDRDGNFSVDFPTFTWWVRRGYSSRDQRWYF